MTIGRGGHDQGVGYILKRKQQEKRKIQGYTIDYEENKEEESSYFGFWCGAVCGAVLGGMIASLPGLIIGGVLLGMFAHVVDD